MQTVTTRLFISGALCALSTTALAQSSVTLYGIIDTGVEYVSHANAAGGHVFRMPAVTGELPSRWGLRGAEDLGGGYSAVFTLESGFNVRDGSSGQGGRLFGRQAFVGLKGPYGTMAFGRQYTMTYLALQGADIIGPDIYGMGSLDAYVPNARADNSVTYMGTYKGFTLGAGYSFGRDSAGTGNSPGQGTCAGSVAGHPTECRDWSVMLKYDAPNFGVAASYEEQRGGTNAQANFFDGVAPTPLGNAADKDARTHVSAYAQYAGAKLGAGWLGRRVVTDSPAVPNVRSDLFFVGASYFVTPAFPGRRRSVPHRQQCARLPRDDGRAAHHVSAEQALVRVCAGRLSGQQCEGALFGERRRWRHDARRRHRSDRCDGRHQARVLGDIE